MNKTQDGNTNITHLSVFWCGAFVKMSSHGGFISDFNVMKMTLKSGKDTISRLAHKLNVTSTASDQIN